MSMRTLVAIQLALPALLLSSGCKARDGDILLKVCGRLGEKLEVATGTSVSQVTATLRGAAGDASLGTRVQNRLRWDRYLHESEIEVSLTATNVVTLRGQVADRALKQRAYELARTTVGIEKVVDELTLPEEE
jgi:hypothetical protein